MHLHMSFSELDATPFGCRAENFHSLWRVFCATFDENLSSGQVRSRSYDVIKGTTFDKISAKS